MTNDVDTLHVQGALLSVRDVGHELGDTQHLLICRCLVHTAARFEIGASDDADYMPARRGNYESVICTR